MRCIDKSGSVTFAVQSNFCPLNARMAVRCLLLPCCSLATQLADVLFLGDVLLDFHWYASLRFHALCPHERTLCAQCPHCMNNPHTFTHAYRTVDGLRFALCCGAYATVLPRVTSTTAYDSQGPCGTHRCSRKLANWQSSSTYGHGLRAVL